MGGDKGEGNENLILTLPHPWPLPCQRKCVEPKLSGEGKFYIDILCATILASLAGL
jgi:hypothetical protein